MSAKILREGIIKIGKQEQFEVETYGELQFLPQNAQSVFAHFGMFRRTMISTLLYKLGAEFMDVNSCDSHYLDDLACLKAGNVDVVEFRHGV